MIKLVRTNRLSIKIGHLSGRADTVPYHFALRSYTAGCLSCPRPAFVRHVNPVSLLFSLDFTDLRAGRSSKSD